jgi:hypothetical protein
MTATYTIHEPAGLLSDPLERAEAIDFVKEGFSWFALFIPLLWLILAAYVIVMLSVPVFLAIAGIPQTVSGWITTFLGIIFAMYANDLLRWRLSRRNYRFVGAVTGRNLEECELKFFSSWQGPEETVIPPAPAVAASRPKSGRKRTSEEEVIGLFPGTER